MTDPDTVLWINLCRIRRYKSYGIAFTTFGARTQNVKRINFLAGHIPAYHKLCFGDKTMQNKRIEVLRQPQQLLALELKM